MIVHKVSVSAVVLACAALCIAPPAFAQRTVKPSSITRKNNRPIAILKSDQQVVFPTRAKLQAQFATDRTMKRADWEAIAKTRPAPLQTSSKPDTLPASANLTEATDSGALSATLTTAQAATDVAFLNFENAARVSAKDNEAEFIQTGAQYEQWGDSTLSYKPTAALYLGFASKKKRYYFVSVTFEYKTPFGVELESNQMVAFPPSLGYLSKYTYYNEGVISSKTYDMEWIYDTNGNGIDGWTGFRIFLANPGRWIFKSATVKEIAKP